VVPVLRDRHITILREQVGKDLSTPAALFESASCLDRLQHTVPMLEAIVFAIEVLLVEAVEDR